MTKSYEDKPIEKWNANDFIRYMDDLHQELFGVAMAPMRSWSAERGLVGTAIGTQKKAGKHDKEVIKRFIDETFKSYQPTQQYPGTSFMFMYTYRQQDLQRITLAVEKERKENEIQTKQSEGIDEEILDWFSQ